MTDPAEEIRQVLDSMKYHAHRLQALTDDLRRLQALQDSDIRQVVQEAADGRVQAELERNTALVRHAHGLMRMPEWRDVLSVTCPSCGAGEGRLCTGGVWTVHKSRQAKAMELDTVQAAARITRRAITPDEYGSGRTSGARDVWSVPCPVCGAEEGTSCFLTTGYAGVHPERRTAAVLKLGGTVNQTEWSQSEGERTLDTGPHGAYEDETPEED